MQSNFNQARPRSTGGSRQIPDETYDLRGLDLRDPDQITPKGETPYLINSRMYARDTEDSRVAQRTRKGSVRSSTPVDEAEDVTNTAGDVGDAEFTANTWIAEPFTPTTTGALTKLELEIYKTVTGTGHVIVEIFDDDSGEPGTLLAQGSISNGLITVSAQYLTAYFMDAPTLTSSTQYWHRVRVESEGTATYGITRTAASGGLSTIANTDTYTALGYTWRYKSHISTAGDILGFTRRYPSNLANRTIFAMGTDIYSVTNLGAVTSINSDVGATASKVRFAHIDDKTIWVDGEKPARWWDGITVSDMANVDGTPTHVIVYKNRTFFIPEDDPTRVNFSDLFDFESYASTNFFYVPSPKSQDRITGWLNFQDNLSIFTHETKFTLYGSDLGSFTLREAIGTKGAVSQEAMAVDRNYIYFMADDRNIYRWNGVEDELLSEKVEPLLQDIADVSKVRFHIYKNQLRIYYPSGTDTQSEDMLLLELSERESNKHLQWFHDTGRAVMGSLEWKQDDNELIEFSSRVGAYYLGEFGEDDLGKIISFKYWTNYKPYGSGASKTRIKRFRPFVRPVDAPYILRVGKDIDFENNPEFTDVTVEPGGAIWGAFDWNDGTLWGDNTQFVDTKVPMSGRGKFTQFRFECDRLAAPVEIYGYMALLKAGRIR